MIPERSSYPEFRARLRARYGGRIVLARADIPGRDTEHQPWALWACDRTGEWYCAFDMVDTDGRPIEPGDWAITALEGRRSDNIWGQLKGGARLWATRQQAAKRERFDRFTRRASEQFKREGLDSFLHKAGIRKSIPVAKLESK